MHTLCELLKSLYSHTGCVFHCFVKIAVKCNDDPVVLALLAQLGTGSDCASKVSYFTHLNLHHLMC